MFSEVVGHSFQLERIKKLVEEGKFPSSSIFSGPEGVGKKLVARLTLESLTGSSLNVRLIGEEKPPTIDNVREMISWLFVKPSSGKGKGVVIDRADEMRTETANALLKTLEEPPSYAYIILIAKNENSLLPTIRSRCRIFRFGKLSETNVEHVLRKLGIDFDKRVLKLCGGSVGNAMKLSESIVPELVERISKALSSNEREKHFVEISEKFKDISREDLELFINALESYLQSKDAYIKWMEVLKNARKFLKFYGKPRSILEWMMLKTFGIIGEGKVV